MRSRIEQSTLALLANFGEQVVPALLKQSELADYRRGHGARRKENMR